MQTAPKPIEPGDQVHICRYSDEQFKGRYEKVAEVLAFNSLRNFYYVVTVSGIFVEARWHDEAQEWREISRTG